MTDINYLGNQKPLLLIVIYVRLHLADLFLYKNTINCETLTALQIKLRQEQTDRRGGVKIEKTTPV